MFFSFIAFHEGVDTRIRDGIVDTVLQFLFSVKIFPYACRCFLFITSQEYIRCFRCDIYYVPVLCKLFMSVSVLKSIIM